MPALALTEIDAGIAEPGIIESKRFRPREGRNHTGCRIKAAACFFHGDRLVDSFFLAHFTDCLE